MQITYLFGAGASCQALPIVNQIPPRLENMILRLERNEFDFSNDEIYNDLSLQKTLDNIVDDLKWLKVSAENHASVDTLAKKLYLKERYDELDKLKRALSIFLLLEQLINPADKR